MPTLDLKWESGDRPSTHKPSKSQIFVSKRLTGTFAVSTRSDKNIPPYQQMVSTITEGQMMKRSIDGFLAELRQDDDGPTYAALDRALDFLDEINELSHGTIIPDMVSPSYDCGVTFSWKTCKGSYYVWIPGDPDRKSYSTHYIADGVVRDKSVTVEKVVEEIITSTNAVR